MHIWLWTPDVNFSRLCGVCTVVPSPLKFPPDLRVQCHVEDAADCHVARRQRAAGGAGVRKENAAAPYGCSIHEYIAVPPIVITNGATSKFLAPLTCQSSRPPACLRAGGEL